jgi:tRNA A-37 threonylcarbamoyl transferase component Bud32/tetratricopeptide (TPR) repeat protein
MTNTVLPTQPATARPEDHYLGKVVGDRYRLLGRIGEGGMGRVYRAEHTLMKKILAIKLLHVELGQIEEMVRRFEREAQSASRLSHPNIITVTDFGRADSGELYLVMEYLPGRSLADAIAEARILPVPRALGIARQMLSALAHAHGHGIVHRDLKPANVMLTRSAERQSDDVVKILDFGVAKMTQDLSPAATGFTLAGVEASAPASVPDKRLTRMAMVFGTPSYMSPEQATGEEADARSDIYSCGVILYEMLTGRKPFVATDLVKILAMQVTAPPPSFADAAPGVPLPAALEAAVMRALEKDRTRRYPSAQAFAAALSELELAMAPSAVAAAAVSRARWIRAGLRATALEMHARYQRLPPELRRWTPIAGVVGVVLLLVIVSSLLFGKSPAASPPLPPRPVAAAVLAPLQLVDDALVGGRLPEARARLLQLLSRFPREARVHYLLGHLEIREKRPAAALAAYEQALALDTSLREDAALLLNVRAVLADRDRKLAFAAFSLLADHIGAPAGNDLARIASGDRRPEFRAAGRGACLKLGCDAQVDLVQSYSLDLVQAKSCDEKREAVRGLAGTRDRRAVDPLRKARSLRGPLGGILGGGNDCVRKDIDIALEHLGS